VTSVRSVLSDPASGLLFLGGAAPANNFPNDTTPIGRGPAWMFQSRLPHPSNTRVWGRQVARSAKGASTTGGGSCVRSISSSHPHFFWLRSHSARVLATNPLNKIPRPEAVSPLFSLT
jgi:hypothetical protein